MTDQEAEPTAKRYSPTDFETTSASKYSTPSRPLGLRTGVALDKALRLASDQEDAEIVCRISRSPRES